MNPYPDPPGGGRGTTGGKAGLWATALFPEWGSELAWELACELAAKHGQPHSLQGPQLPYLQEPRGLVLCRAVSAFVGKVLILSFSKTS